jgi:hypothetical protein
VPKPDTASPTRLVGVAAGCKFAKFPRRPTCFLFRFRQISIELCQEAQICRNVRSPDVSKLSPPPTEGSNPNFGETLVSIDREVLTATMDDAGRRLLIANSKASGTNKRFRTFTFLMSLYGFGGVGPVSPAKLQSTWPFLNKESP